MHQPKLPQSRNRASLDAEAVQLLRKFVDVAETSPAPSGRSYIDRSTLLAARNLLHLAEASAGDQRDALAALRDLVWRVDTARYFLEEHRGLSGLEPVFEILDTVDIHRLLKDQAAPLQADGNTVVRNGSS